MKKIIVEINCNEEHCGSCLGLENMSIPPFCSFYKKNLRNAKIYKTPYRCKQCLDAEVKDDR